MYKVVSILVVDTSFLLVSTLLDGGMKCDFSSTLLLFLFEVVPMSYTL